jgi:hypothetical protein
VERKGEESDRFLSLKISIALSAFTSHIIRMLASSLKIPHSTICDPLRGGNFPIEHLRSVPRELDDSGERARVETANSMLQMIADAFQKSFALRQMPVIEHGWTDPLIREHEGLWATRGTRIGEFRNLWIGQWPLKRADVASPARAIQKRLEKCRVGERDSSHSFCWRFSR